MNRCVCVGVSLIKYLPLFFCKLGSLKISGKKTTTTNNKSVEFINTNSMLSSSSSLGQ